MTSGNDDIDIDVTDDNLPDDSADAQEKQSLKDVWNKNPLLKVAAVVVVGALLAVIYIKVDPEKQEVISRVGSSAFDNVKGDVGKEQLDKEYSQAVQDQNKQRAEAAAATGGSAIPTPVVATKNQGLDIPQAAGAGGSGDEDPLQQWKSSVAMKATSIRAQEDEDKVALQPQPDVVPMVQPIRPKPVSTLDPQMVNALAGQMRTIIASQTPPPHKSASVTAVKNDYAKKIETEKKEEDERQRAKIAAAGGLGTGGVSAGGDTAAAASASTATGKVIIPAGQMAYAQLITELNTDIPAPVLVQVVSGPFEGGRALGTMQKQDDYISLRFSRVVKDGVSYSIDAIALDEDTTLPAQRTAIDHHYLTRVILPAAAKFIQGYGSSVAQTGTETTTTAGGGVASSTPKPNAKENIYKGVESASQTLSQIVEEDAHKPVTIHLARGTTMGILFLESVKTTNVE